MPKIMHKGVSYGGGGSGGDNVNHVKITQEEYDALVEAGTVDPNVVYFIPDGETQSGGSSPSVSLKIDDTLSTESTNAVQNKVIAAELNAIKSSFSTAANAIGDALVAKGVTVPEGTSLTDMASLITKNLVSSNSKVSLSGSFTDSSLYNQTLTRLITFSRTFGQVPTVTVATSSSSIVCKALSITQTSFIFQYTVPSYGIQNNVTFSWSAQANSFV
jgi:hypothetical protein